MVDPLGMNANQLQITYNKQLNDYNKKLFGDSVKFAALQNTKKSIGEVREKREASFAQSENDRFNAPNPFEPVESALGPMTPRNTVKPKGDATGILGNNVIDTSIFNTGSSMAASNMFGNEASGSFDRTMPPTIQELNPDQTGMNSLYNKTI
jgi:hypothetical protein